MPFPYELYPKAKETHCLNLPEISVSRPPFPGSIRTVDGCLWGWRDNNSYVSTHKTDRVCTADGKCYNYNDVFVDEVDPGYSNTCGQTCYVACSCNTSNGWYSSCQGSDCFSVTDTRYAGQPNAASASRSLSDVASISASGANSGISAMAAAAKSGLKTASAAGNYTATAASAAAATAGATSGISTLASGATTCYKVRGCDEGWFEEKPSDMFSYKSTTTNGKNCYQVTGCKSGYHTYNWSGITSAFDKVTHRYAPQDFFCYEYNCSSGYTTVQDGYTCKSGGQWNYNGSKKCCPNDDIEEKNDYFTFVVSAGYGCDTFTGSGAYIGGVYDGKGKWFGSGYIGAFDTATVTSQAAAGKGSVCACVIPGEQNGPTYYTYGIPSTSLYESSEGNLKRCFSDSPSSYNSNCQKTDYVTGNSSAGTPSCSCMYYTFQPGLTYILKANSCTRYTG